MNINTRFLLHVVGAVSLLVYCSLCPAQQAASPKSPASARAKSNQPPPLQGLAQTITAARLDELSLRNFNNMARALSIPVQPEGQGPIFGATQSIDSLRHGVIVRRLTDPARTDIIVHVIRGDTMHLYFTAPDGLLQTAIQRDRDGATRTVSGREVDAAFRDEIQIWRNWERDYLRRAAQNGSNKK